MKLLLKAYKITFPSLFDYTKDMWEDSNEYQLIYGKSQKEAVNDFCKNDENHSYYELKNAIRTRRYKEADLYEQEKSVLLESLSDKQINHLTHSLGVYIGDKIPNVFYRNYSVYENEVKDCDVLVDLKLMEKYGKFEQVVYKVTVLGKEAVKTLLLTTKQNFDLKHTIENSL